MFSLNNKKSPLLFAVLLFIVGVITANLAAWQQGLHNQVELQQLFEEETKKSVDSIIKHIKTYEYPLLGIRGMVVAYGDDSISREAFRTYALARNMDIEFPSARGFGFVRRVARTDEANFLTKARQDGMLDFAIKELAPHDGERYIVQYAEPADRNQLAIGLDIASEPTRKTAAQQAMQAGSITITAPITLIQTSGLPLRSFVLLLPVYHLTMPLYSAEQREAATFGWAYAAVVIDDVLKRAGIMNEQMAIQVADVSLDKGASVFYADTDFEATADTQNTATITRVIFGRNWQFNLRAQPLFYQCHERLSPLWLASFITFCAFLASVLLYFYLSYRQRTLSAAIEQARLAAIVESANDAIISLDLEGVVTSWNSAAEMLLGFSAENAIGKKIRELIIPDELLDKENLLLRTIGRGEFIPRHNTVRKTQDGRLIDVSVMFSPIRNKNSKVIGSAKTIIDITEQKRCEELFRLTIEAIPDAILTVNHNNIITLVNQKTVSLFGYEKSELIGQNISLLIPKRYHQQHLAHTKAFYAHPVTHRILTSERILSAVCKNGIEVPIEIQLSPIQATPENFTLVVIGDDSIRNNLQAEIQTALARLKMAITALDVGVWVWRLDDNELIWDQRMFTLYGVLENQKNIEINYDFWASRLHPEDREQTEHLIMQCVDGLGSYDTDFRIVLDNGEIRHIHAAAILERDQAGTLIQMVGVNQDITAIKTAAQQIQQLNEQRTTELKTLNTSLEQQVETRTAELKLAMEVAEQASHAKTDFLANMSHEIRTPMNAIIGLTYLLKKQELNANARDMVNKIDAAGYSLLGIINECLDFSKIEANLLEIEEAPFRLTDIFDNLANIMSTAVGAKPVEVCIAPAPNGADYLRGDRIRLMQVLTNLVSNAIKFTEQGEVVVDVKIIDSRPADKQIYLNFSVRDTGIGIPADKQESIFHPFMQADNSTTRVYGGTGLGLTISRRLVELMGGTLQLKSQEDVGSEFSFDLLLTVSNMADNSIPLLNYQQVLIADDNETARKLLESIVVSLGWNACVVDSGEKALEVLVTKGVNYFDVLLLDWRMPKIDGIEVVTRIQEQLGKEHSPVIIMVTAYDRDILLTLPKLELIDHIISKPVTSSSLFNALLEAKIKKGGLSTSTHQQDENNQQQQLLGLNLLVVDDSEINRDVAYQILSGEGANIELAVNGLEAVNLLLTKPNYFHVVLMDVQMPIMDGYAATRKIRDTPELSHLPIIALSAGAFKSQHLAALEAGMNDFVAKPFEAEVLVACINRIAHVKLNQKMALSKDTGKNEALPLIDVEHALKTWRTVESYQKNLRLFLQQHSDDVENLNHSDKSAIMAIAHKLRGSAGALSLKRMVHCVEKVEANVNEQAMLDAAINDLTSVFLQTIDAINAYFNVKTSPITEQKIVQNIPTSVITELTQLLVTLDSDDPNLIEEQLYALSGKLPKESFDQLQTAVENFNFRGAETLLAALITENSQINME